MEGEGDGVVDFLLSVRRINKAEELDAKDVGGTAQDYSTGGVTKISAYLK